MEPGGRVYQRDRGQRDSSGVKQGGVAGACGLEEASGALPGGGKRRAAGGGAHRRWHSREEARGGAIGGEQLVAWSRSRKTMG